MLTYTSVVIRTPESMFTLMRSSLTCHSIPFIATYILASLFLVTSFLSLIKRRDYWPFSCYPMFSTHMSWPTQTVIRFKLCFSDDTTQWWQPHFFKLPLIFSRELQRANAMPS